MEKQYKYETVYEFQLLTELKKGETVHFMDRLQCAGGKVNALRADELFNLLNVAEAETAEATRNGKRIEFYKIIEVESEGEE